MRASIGRIVHFVLNHGPNAGAHRPAIVVGVNDDDLDLQVFSNGTKGRGDSMPNVFNVTAVKQNQAAPELGTWHWPERESDNEHELQVSRANA